MVRVRVIGQKQKPVVERLTLGQKVYGGIKRFGQKVYHNEYVRGAAGAAAAATAGAIYKGAVLPGIQGAMAPGMSNAGVASTGSAASTLNFPSVPRQPQGTMDDLLFGR